MEARLTLLPRYKNGIVVAGVVVVHLARMHAVARSPGPARPYALGAVHHNKADDDEHAEQSGFEGRNEKLFAHFYFFASKGSS